jgi:hypothetical protein
MNIENMDRPLSSETFSQQLYQDDCVEILRLSQETAREPAELIREIISEGLSARRRQMTVMTGILQSLRQLVDQNRLLIEQNRSAKEANERLQVRVELAEERWESLKRSLIQNLREFYGLQLENLGATIATKNLVWNYVVQVILDQSGCTREEMEQKYTEEKKKAIDERESIALALEQAAENLEAPNASVLEGNYLDELGVNLEPKASDSRAPAVGDRNGFEPYTPAKS